jgi:Family of unknown function (DUF6272)
MVGVKLYELRNYLRENGIIFCYSGYLTEDTLLGIGDAIKKKLTLDQTDRQTIRVVFSIFVEQVQNVIRYSAERQGEDGDNGIRYGVLAVGRLGDDIFLSCGNIIHAEDVDRLRDALTEIQKLDRDQLKKLWKQTLRGGPPEGSKGAGIGFIDIAWRARKGIEFDFTEIDQDSYFFTLKAYI